MANLVVQNQNGISKHTKNSSLARISSAYKNELKIRDEKSDDTITNSLVIVFNLTGLKGENTPKGLQRNVLVEFIKKNYAGLAASEIVTAFELAAKRDFEVELNHYQNFSPLYFSNVMNSYKQYRQSVLKKVVQEKATQKEVSEEEKQKIQNEYLIQQVIKPFELYKKTKKLEIPATSIEMSFKTLENIGVINISLDEKKKTFNRIEKELDKEWKQKSKTNSITKSENILKQLAAELLNPSNEKGKQSRKNQIVKACRKYYMEKLFLEWRTSNVDVKKLILR